MSLILLLNKNLIWKRECYLSISYKSYQTFFALSFLQFDNSCIFARILHHRVPSLSSENGCIFDWSYLQVSYNLILSVLFLWTRFISNFYNMLSFHYLILKVVSSVTRCWKKSCPKSSYRCAILIEAKKSTYIWAYFERKLEAKISQKCPNRSYCKCDLNVIQIKCI